MYRTPTHSLILTLASAAALAVGGGCATVMTGTSQAISVETSPPGAHCRLSREGEFLGTVSTTPGTITVDKDRDSLTVSCKKPGYLEASQDLDSSRQLATFGNLAMGLFVGAIIDHASGAARKYPSSISLTLIPAHFDSQTQRQAFFQAMRDQVEQDADAALAQAGKNCEDEECAERQQKINDLRQQKLDEISRKEAATSAG